MKTPQKKKPAPKRTSTNKPKAKPSRNAAQQLATLLGIPATVTSSAGIPIRAVPKAKPTPKRKKKAK
jgi:hypothetical protein